MVASLKWRDVLTAGCLSATAGFVDVVGYLRLGGYFVSFMSGNTTRASAELVHGSVRGMVLALGLVGFFVLGVVLSTLTTRRLASRRRVVLGSAGILVAAAALAPTVGAEPAVPPLLAMAMGVVNTSYTANGEVSIGLTYMTGTLVKIGQNFAAAVTGDHHHQRWMKYFVLWAMISLGALVGGLAYQLAGLASLWIAAVSLWIAATLTRHRHPTGLIESMDIQMPHARPGRTS